MPSALHSNMSYYQNKVKHHGKGWEDLESQSSMSSPEKAHVAGMGAEMEMESKLEYVGDGEVHTIGENMV